jgi:hypothetical protein
MGVATLYFAIWIGALVVLKELILAEYDVDYRGLTSALVGALILAKVVLVLEHVPLGSWVRHQPAWVDVASRTVLYTVGVFIVIVLEKSFEGRHEHGGFLASMTAAFNDARLDHALANIICVAGALLSFNVITLISESLGEGGLKRIFVTPRKEATVVTA